MEQLTCLCWIAACARLGCGEAGEQQCCSCCPHRPDEVHCNWIGSGRMLATTEERHEEECQEE